MDIKEIIKEYEAGESLGTIAKKYDTYPNKIMRLLKKEGIELRNKSEAQKNALEIGRNKHPTEGTKRTFETKAKISQAIIDNWENLDEKVKDERIKRLTDLWESKTEAEKEQFLKDGIDACRKAGKIGSKLERFLFTELLRLNFRVEAHREWLIPGSMKLHLDLFFPALMVAVEIDGPSHFYPIWGEKSFQRQLRADALKNGYLVNRGVVVIRIMDDGKSTITGKIEIRDKLLEKLKEISKKDFDRKNVSNRIIHLNTKEVFKDESR
jgi:hypothetical protein